MFSEAFVFFDVAISSILYLKTKHVVPVKEVRSELEWDVANDPLSQFTRSQILL